MAEPIIDRVEKVGFQIMADKATADPDMPACVARTVISAVKLAQSEITYDVKVALSAAASEGSNSELDRILI